METSKTCTFTRTVTSQNASLDQSARNRDRIERDSVRRRRKPRTRYQYLNASLRKNKKINLTRPTSSYHLSILIDHEPPETPIRDSNPLFVIRPCPVVCFVRVNGYLHRSRLCPWPDLQTFRSSKKCKY